MMRSPIWLVLAAIGALAAACSSSNNSTNPPQLSSCLAQIGATGALVFPAQNASAVPDNVGQVIIGTTTTLPAGWNVQLFTTTGVGIANGGQVQPAPSPLPTPNTIPPFANPVYQTSAMPSLPAGTTLQVAVNNLNSNCLPNVVGTFTTQ